MWAAQKGHHATVEALAGLGADVQAADAHGTTAIMFAAMHGHHATVEALAGLGADVQEAMKYMKRT